MMGREPLEKEIPIDRSDLYLETQDVFNLYDYLPARWEGFSGTYLGKDLSLLKLLFEHFQFDRPMKQYTFSIIPIIDSYVTQDINRKQKAASKKGK